MMDGKLVCKSFCAIITTFPIIFQLSLLKPQLTISHAIFQRGDSNSDTGGLGTAFGQAPPPNGETFFHWPAGRYFDGRLVIDFMGMLTLAIHNSNHRISAIAKFGLAIPQCIPGCFVEFKLHPWS
ncbi:hypothetical protein E3N88_16749 [Mikania micrantha]|uniref:Uncharacterized protein n=1 Tax=Mikania micrantha TaxID=192012 RepID=A0A5N6NRQ5_9ASTR|nr:hypothetical protein E3N88_16749 [Mikania micrantha]